jgi:hypothetical protein
MGAKPAGNGRGRIEQDKTLMDARQDARAVPVPMLVRLRESESRRLEWSGVESWQRMPALQGHGCVVWFLLPGKSY